MRDRTVLLSAALSIVALLTLFVTQRLASRGRWLPPLPPTIGSWDLTEVPIGEADLGALGKPRAIGFELLNPLQERIYGRIVAANGFDAFQLPMLFQYYEVTAERDLPVLGPGGGRVLAQIYRQRGSDLRILMLSWVQKPDGGTSLLGLLSGEARGLGGRMLLGAEGAFHENRSCIVRLYTILHPADPDGAQGRRNLVGAALALHGGISPSKQIASSSLAPEPHLVAGGKDVAYLADSTTATDTATVANLLPLTPGNSWDFEVEADGIKGAERVVVGPPVTIGGLSAVPCEIQRGGKVWRREFYRQDASGIQLLAFGDGTPNRIEISPPVTLMRYPLKEGDELRWKGVLKVQGRALPATGFSRISAREKLVSPAGRFVAYRLDTVLSIASSKPTHFPAIRWLASNIGFVRRGYADGGKPSIAQLQRFSVK